MSIHNFLMHPLGTMNGPSSSSGGMLVLRGNFDEVYQYNTRVHFKIVPISTPEGLSPSQLQISWLTIENNEVDYLSQIGSDWISPALKIQPHDTLTLEGWEDWVVRAALDITSPMDWLPTDPSAVCTFKMELWSSQGIVQNPDFPEEISWEPQDFLETLQDQGSARFDLPPTRSVANDSGRIWVCPGMKVSVDTFCRNPQYYTSEQG